jgi:hypothetical protein
MEVWSVYPLVTGRKDTYKLRRSLRVNIYSVRLLYDRKMVGKVQGKELEN